MNPHKRAPAVAILAVVIGAWLLAPAPHGLSTTQAARARYIARSPEVNLPVDPVRAAVRLLADRGIADAADEEQLRAVQKSLAERGTTLNLEQLRVIATLRANLPTESEAALRRYGRDAWRLFLVFAGTIALILFDVAPIFVCAVGALATVLLTGLLTPAQGFSGFSNSVIILIVVAFAVARGMVKSGLGARIAYLVIGRFGSSTLGLGYSLAITDSLIAPAFPSNTARSGALYPVAESVARSAGSKLEDGTRLRLGAYLMMNSIAGLSISSGLWLTAMAANPLGAALARGVDPRIDFTFARWLAASSVPSLLALAVVPLVLYRFFPPEVKRTPEAPRLAKEELRRMGPLSRDERIMGATFVGLIACWALSQVLGVNNTAVALAGLLVLLVTRVITMDDIQGNNVGPSTFVWFATLFTLSSYLDKFGFMEWIGENVGGAIDGWPVALVYVTLVLSYVLVHYFFVSQTAHLVAVFPVFLKIGIEAGAPAAMLAMILLLATNFFSSITPQASSANAIFVGSGYVTPREIYKFGGLTTLVNTLIYGVVGTAWIWLLFGRG